MSLIGIFRNIIKIVNNYKILDKKPSHWIFVLSLTFLGIHLGELLYIRGYFLHERYKIYQWMQKLTARHAYAQRTALVLIGDKEYWHWESELARRQPIKRTYLAKLLRALDFADPVVIALDFDLRSPVPDGLHFEHDDYETERQELLNAVEAVSRHRTVVLPKTLDRDSEGNYFLEPAIFDDHKFEGLKVKNGYINLPEDIRAIPPKVLLKDGSYAESFSESITRAINTKFLKSIATEYPLPYGSYLTVEDFLTFSADEILKAEPQSLKSKFQNNQIIIIGASWSRFAFGRGEKIDTYLTPGGTLGGVHIHANYVEALLDSRIYTPWGHSMTMSIEIFGSIVIAIILVTNIGPLIKLILYIFIVFLLVIFSYLSMHLAGRHLEFFIPLILLTGHTTVEKILEWRSAAIAYAKMKAVE